MRSGERTPTKPEQSAQPKAQKQPSAEALILVVVMSDNPAAYVLPRMP
jgi:hypothetical protein